MDRAQGRESPLLFSQWVDEKDSISISDEEEDSTLDSDTKKPHLSSWLSELSICDLPDDSAGDEFNSLFSEFADLNSPSNSPRDEAVDECLTLDTGTENSIVQSIATASDAIFRRSVSEGAQSLPSSVHSLNDVLRLELSCKIRLRQLSTGYEEQEEEEKTHDSMLTYDDIRRREIIRERNKEHARASRQRSQQVLEDLKTRNSELEAQNITLLAEVQELTTLKEQLASKLDACSSPQAQKAVRAGQRDYTTSSSLWSVKSRPIQRRSYSYSPKPNGNVTDVLVFGVASGKKLTP